METKLMHEPFTIAAVQAAPVFLDRARTIEKACDLVADAGQRGARLVVFPEAFVPTYPDWIWVLPPKENRAIGQLYAELVQQSVTIPGPDVARLGEAARAAGVHLAIGINERNAEASGTSLYNTLLAIGPDGQVLGKHRKLVPTAPERMVWTPGDGSTLGVWDTPLGRIGGLICWENYMPLARYAMYAWGTEIYLAPTWDSGEPWLSTLRHIAKEGRVFVVGCCIAMRTDAIPDRYEFKKYYGESKEWVNVGDSAIVDPDGKFIAGPINRREEILCAEIDPSVATAGRWKLDVAGHYARPDVFQLRINRHPNPMLSADGDRDDGPGN
jgi:nitrilase